MAINIEEISQIIRKQVEDYNKQSEVTESGSVRSPRSFSQRTNAHLPMVRTESGSETSVNEVSPEKADSPIVCKPSLNVSDDRA